MGKVIKGIGWSAYLAFHLLGQARVPFLPAGEIRRRQSRRVRRMVRYAYQYVPYYREVMGRLGIRPEAIRHAEDLARLPILENDDLRRDPEYYVSRAVDRARCLGLSSSGTSGAPKTIWHNPAAVFLNAAHGERDRAMMTHVLGRWSGYREIVIVAPVNASQREVQEFVRRHAWFPGRVRIQRKYLSMADPPAKNAALMNEFKPDLLYSYGSYLGMLCTYIRKTGASWHRPRAVLYSSDALSAATREWLTGECGVPVFTVYGSVEALKIGFGCPAFQGIHLNVDLYPVRILDARGEEVAPGEPGELIVSNLVNRATVLLNYRTRDLVSLSARSCECGRTLPLMSYPEGRVDEVIELEDGEAVHPIAFREVCLRDRGIVQYQVRQTAPCAFRIALVAAPEADRRRMAQGVLERFRARFGDRVGVDVQFVEALERTPGCKTPVVISLGRTVSAAAEAEP